MNHTDFSQPVKEASKAPARTSSAPEKTVAGLLKGHKLPKLSLLFPGQRSRKTSSRRVRCQVILPF